VKINCHLG